MALKPLKCPYKTTFSNEKVSPQSHPLYVNTGYATNLGQYVKSLRSGFPIGNVAITMILGVQ